MISSDIGSGTRNSLLWAALPLWTRDELVRGMSLIILNNTLSRLQYQNEYHSLFDALCKVYLCNGSLGFEGSFPYPDALMLLEERHSEEDTALLSPGDALEYLLDAAIDRFGYSSRDVFHAVFKYSQMTWRHKGTFFFFFFFDLNYADLQLGVSALAHNASAKHSISDWIFTLHPVDPKPLAPLHLDVDFKLDWVTRNVIQKLHQENVKLLNFYLILLNPLKSKLRKISKNKQRDLLILDRKSVV